MRDDLRWNKIFGAILATLLVIFSLRQLSEAIYATSPPAKPGDIIAVQIAPTDQPAAPDVPPDWGTVLKTADVAAGQAVSQKCLSCHSFTQGGPNGTGPNNWGVIGRQPGTHPGFNYSSAMVAFGQKVHAWDYDHLYMFLAGPQAYIDGTKMSFVGLKQPQDRVNLIAWLRLQSSNPAPIPPPNPKAAAAAAPAAAGAAPAANAAAGASSATDASGAAAGGSTATSSQTGAGTAASAPSQTTTPGGVPK